MEELTKEELEFILKVLDEYRPKDFGEEVDRDSVCFKLSSKIGG